MNKSRSKILGPHNYLQFTSKTCKNRLGDHNYYAVNHEPHVRYSSYYHYRSYKYLPLICMKSIVLRKCYNYSSLHLSLSQRDNADIVLHNREIAQIQRCNTLWHTDADVLGFALHDSHVHHQHMCQTLYNDVVGIFSVFRHLGYVC